MSDGPVADERDYRGVSDKSWEALRAMVLNDISRIDTKVHHLATKESVDELKQRVHELANEVHKLSLGVNTVTVKSGATGAITSIAVILIAILLEYLRRAFSGH